jgi:hypothetical protein
VSILVSLFKWPLAVVVALLTPAAALSTWQLLLQAKESEFWFSPFALGFAATFLFLVVFHRASFIQLWATIDHEATHAIFAWLTLVRVYGIRATDGYDASSNGGSLGHVALGGSNWLITISPYFFPTASAGLLACTWVLAAEPTMLASVLLGMATAWSIVSTWHETHLGQTDLKEVGYAFALILLPGANLLCYGALLANELGGPVATAAFAASAIDITLAWLQPWIP